MSVGYLRQRFTSWAWSAARHGMGWNYIGRLGRREVKFYAVSRIVDEFENTRTEWRAAEGEQDGAWFDWMHREEARAAEVAA